MDSMTNSSIPPFWNCIPKFFLYALQPNPLILATTLGVVSYFFGGHLINLVLLAVALKYSMVALQESAEGILRPPALSSEVLVNNYELPFKLYILTAFFYAYLGYAGNHFGIGMFFALLGLGILLYPAVVIALVMSESFFFAINPLNLISIVRGIGWPYLIMFVFLFLLSSAEETVTALFLNNVSTSLLAPTWLSINTLFTIITFHMMGYVIMQYHEELGAPEQEDDTQSDIYTTPLLKRFMEEGNIAAATAELTGLINENPQDLELHRRMYVYLAATGQEERLAGYAPQYLEMLTRAGRNSDAARVYIESRERGINFFPATPSLYLPLMRALRQYRAGKMAVTLANGFHKRFESNPHIPEVYLELAKILCEDLQRDDLAVQALEFIQKKHPDSTLINEVLQLKNALSEIMGSPAVNSSA